MCSRPDKRTHYLAPVNHGKSAHPTVCFGLSWSGGYTYDDVISIYRDMVFPTHMYCTTAKNIDNRLFVSIIIFLLPITTPEVVTKPLPYTKDQCFIDVNQDNCAHHL